MLAQLSSSRCSVLLAIALCLISVSCDRKPASAPNLASNGVAKAEPPTFPDSVIVDATHYPVSGGAAPGYVADHACASCHSDIYKSYQSMGMARSFYRPDPNNVAEDMENNHYYHERSNRHYEMRVEDGDYYMRRYRLDGNDRRYAVIDQKIDWIVGSGNHARSYFYQSEIGELFQLPLSWYSQSRTWAMSPGFEGDTHEGFGRVVKHECMFCHNAMPNIPEGSDAYSLLSLYPAELEHGVGCQRCHGPGAQHAERASDGDATLESILSTIVNPAKLPQKLREDVCYQCHLQPTSDQNSFLRVMDKGVYSYRPGQSLEDHIRFLDFGNARQRQNRFEINHHPYRMRQSKCYIESDGKLECLSCHDPHRKITATERTSHYRKKCLGCHGSDDCDVDAMKSKAGSDVNDCTECHMPVRRPHDVVEVLMTDHLIRRDPAPANWQARFEPGPKPGYSIVEPYDRGSPVATDVAELYSAMGGLQKGLGPAGKLQAAIDRIKPKEAMPHVMLGMDYVRRGDYDRAISTYQSVLRDYPTLPIAHINVGIALSKQGKSARGIEHLTEALEQFPEHPLLHLNLGSLLLDAGDLDGAREHLETATRLRPSLAVGHQRLGDALIALKRHGEGVQAYEKALAYDPDLVAVYLALGETLPRLGRLDDALRLLEEGTRVDPTDARMFRGLAWACLAKSTVDPKYRENALEFGQKALDLAPLDLISKTRLPFYLWLNDRNAEADSALQAARNSGADKVSCDLMQSLVMIRYGEVDEARQVYYDARRLAKETPPTRLRAILLRHLKRLFAVKIQILDE